MTPALTPSRAGKIKPFDVLKCRDSGQAVYIRPPIGHQETAVRRHTARWRRYPVEVVGWNQSEKYQEEIGQADDAKTRLLQQLEQLRKASGAGQ